MRMRVALLRVQMTNERVSLREQGNTIPLRKKNSGERGKGNLKSEERGISNQKLEIGNLRWRGRRNCGGMPGLSDGQNKREDVEFERDRHRGGMRELSDRQNCGGMLFNMPLRRGGAAEPSKQMPRYLK